MAIADRQGLTRPRMSQIMALLWLAPDIQEEALHLEAVNGSEPIGKRQLRQITSLELWADQRRHWARLKATFWPRKRVRPAHRQPGTESVSEPAAAAE